MPFTFLAHQAPVLPLKAWRPRWFSGAGLVIGSMAPDFEKFLSGSLSSRYAHSLAGQFTYCLPVSLAVYWLATRLVAPPLARFIPDLGALRLRDYAAGLAADRPTRWLVLATSILIGSMGHVAFDGFTHGDPRVVALFPFLAPRILTVAGRRVESLAFLQIVASVAAGAASLAMMVEFGRHRRALAWAGLAPHAVPAHAERSPAAARYWRTVAGTTVAIVASVVILRIAGGGSTHRRGLAYAVLFRVPVAGFASLCVAAVGARRSPVPPASPAPRGVRAASRPPAPTPDEHGTPR